LAIVRHAGRGQPAGFLGSGGCRAFFTDWASGELASATLVTMQVLVSGMLIGMLIAAVLTIFATWSQIGEDILVLLTSMLNPLPAIAILPLAILWFGLGPTALGLRIFPRSIRQVPPLLGR
jgi:ABC-type nitrate/sulfonate/bicarbonate transport system permease component